MEATEVTEKRYRIGEVAELLGVKAYVLRFWESEFPQLDPYRSAKGQRHYGEKDIALLQRIKYLLYEQGLTIDGARKLLSGAPVDPQIEQAVDAYTAKVENAAQELPEGAKRKASVRDFLATLRTDLAQVRELLVGYDPTEKGNTENCKKETSQ